MTKQKLFGIAGMVLLACITGCKAPRMEKVERIVPVKIYVAQPDTLSEYVSLTGGVEAVNDAVVYSKVSERLTVLNVKTGDYVKAGQILAEQYNRSALQGKNAAGAALKSAEAQMTSRKDDFTRIRNLYAKKAVTEQQFNQAEIQLSIAEAAVEQAMAALDQAVVQYENTLLRAPFAGRVATIYYDKNETVTVGQQVIKIVNAHTIKAKLNVPSVDMEKVEVGKRVTAEFPALPGERFSGMVYRIDEAVNPQTRTLTTEIRLENNDKKLKSGMFGEFRIEAKRHEKTVVVNELTVLNRTEVITDNRGFQTDRFEHYVYCVSGGKAAKRIVTPGIVSGGYTELAEGVSFGDSIIVVGQNILKDGDAVRIVNGTER